MFAKLFQYCLFALASACVALLGGPVQPATAEEDLYILGGGGGGAGSDSGSGGGGGGGAGGYVGTIPTTIGISGGKGGGGASGGYGGGSNGVRGIDNTGGTGGQGIGEGASNGQNGSDATSGASAGAGGAGGNAMIDLAEDARYGKIIITGGGGGGSNSTASGGAGGDASFIAKNCTITLTDSLEVSSRTALSNYTSVGTGGSASFIASNLTLVNAQDTITLNFTQNDGNVLVEIGQLDARAADVAITLTGISAISPPGPGGSTIVAGVMFDEIMLGGDHSFWLNAEPDSFSFNSLSVYGSAALYGDLDASGKIINFYLPYDIAHHDVMLLVYDNITLDNATVNLYVSGDVPQLELDDVIYLIGTNNLTGTISSEGTRSVGAQGISTVLEFAVEADTYGLYATVTGVQGPEENDQLASQLRTLGQSRLASLLRLNQGADLLEAQGLAQLRAAGQTVFGPAAFAAVSGSTLSHDSDFKLDLHGLNLVAGLGYNLAPGVGNSGTLLAAAFFEAGWGKYDTQDGPVRADGHTRYYGGGLLARYDAPSSGPGNFYLLGSLKAGRIETGFHSTDFISSGGNLIDFDSSSAYYGLHLGLGYLVSLSANSSLDLYTSYYWSRLAADSLVIQGDQVEFDKLDSQRWRTGLRYNHLLPGSGPVVGLYLGAAYEHEFKAVEYVHVADQTVQSHDLKGGTGIAELGLNIKPAANSGFSVDLSAQGYIGQRQGFGGTVRLQYVF